MGEEAGFRGWVIRELGRLAERLSPLIGLRSLVLFGSVARGLALRESDVDVLVVAEGFRGLPFYEREYIVLRSYTGSLALEPWCYTPEEAWRALLERPRIDVVDALEYGVVVFDGGFWEKLRRAYMQRRPRRTPYGGIRLGE